MAYQYPKGHGKIEGAGRPKGSKTKNSLLRELIRDFAADRFGDYILAWESIEDPADKAKEYREMLKYVVPTISSIQFENDTKITNAQEHLRALTGYTQETTKKK